MTDHDQDGLKCQIWQHVNSGGLYVVVGEGVLREHDLTECIVYRSLIDGQLWVRPATEFSDGRFRKLSLKDIAPPPVSAQN